MAKLKRTKHPEIGGIAHLEHVNFEVNSHDMVSAFFMGGLGFTRDPIRMVSVYNMWVNVGKQQFHLPIGDAIPFAGEVGVTVPKLKDSQRSLKRIASKLGGEASVESQKGRGSTFSCHFPGTRIDIRPAKPAVEAQLCGA